MESVKKFFEHLNIRLSNPFFSSLVISWLLWNWHVPIALLFTDDSSLLSGNYLNYMDYIRDTVDCWSGFVLPVLSALAYVLLSPQIERLISNYQTEVAKEKDRKNLQTLEGTVIPIDKYMTLRKTIDQREIDLKEAIEKETVNLKELNAAKSSINKLEGEKNSLQKLLDNANLNLTSKTESLETIHKEYTQISNVYLKLNTLSDILHGAWINEYQSISNNTGELTIGKEPFDINANYYMHNGRAEYLISDIVFTNNTHLQFAKKPMIPDKFDSTVYLIRAYPNYWIGCEIEHENKSRDYSFIRFYPASTKINTFLFLSNERILNTAENRALAAWRSIRPSP